MHSASLRTLNLILVAVGSHGGFYGSNVTAPVQV